MKNATWGTEGRIEGKGEFPNKAAVIGNKIYFCEGYSRSKNNNCWNYLKMYDCEKNTLTTLCRMPHRGNWKGMGMTSLNGFLYVAGGNIGDKPECSNVFQYSPNSNTWTEVEKMEEKRFRHELVALNGLIYAIGGMTTGSIECYNPSTNKWKYLTYFESSVTKKKNKKKKNKIYIIADSKFGVFDPELITLKNLPKLSFKFKGTLLSTHDKLLLIGNESKETVGFEFDTINNSYSKLFHQTNSDQYFFDQTVVINF